MAVKSMSCSLYSMESFHYITNYIAKIHLYGLTQTKNYDNLSVISVFALCSDMPVLIDSFRARIVRVATMCN